MIFKSIKHTFLTILVTVLILAGCKSAENKQVQESTAYIAIAKNKLGDQVKFTFNEDRSYVLAQSEIAQNGNDLSFSFFVFDVKNEKVVLEQKVESGFVKWLSNLEIEVFKTPGIMRRDQTRDDYTEVYHVVTLDSKPKKDWLKSKG